MSVRTAARQFRVGVATVQRWVHRAAGQRLDRVDWSDQPAGPHQPAQRTPPDMEDLVLTVRRALREQRDRGEFGAAAIQRELQARTVPNAPAVRTINRILARRGALAARQRVRHTPPPRGWYRPDVAAGDAELDECDAIAGVPSKDGPEVEGFTASALHSGLSAAWPSEGVSAAAVRGCLIAHWRAGGVPSYAQFDTDTRFHGPHQPPAVVSAVLRLCLSLGVVPVWVPPRARGVQAASASCNGRWQATVWVRFQHASLAALHAQSAKSVAARRVRAAVRREQAPARRPFPADWQFTVQRQPQGRLIFLRRTTQQGAVQLVGHTFSIDARWPHRWVRCAIDLTVGRIQFFRLRQRAPADQPLVGEVPYTLPRRRFRE